MAAYLRTIAVAAIPVLFLVIHVAMRTTAVSGGYLRNHLQQQIRSLSVENASLQAEVRRLQSPARILQEAGALGMERPAAIKFVDAPVARRIASR